MGRPPRRFPRANGLFCTPHSDHRATAKTMDAMDEQPLHLQRDMTHDAFRRYLEARTELAELASVLIVGVDSNSLIVASRTPVWQVRGEGGYGIQHPEELLRVVGGYDTAADKGTIPYPTGQISGTQRDAAKPRRKPRAAACRWRPPPASVRLPRPRALCTARGACGQR